MMVMLTDLGLFGMGILMLVGQVIILSMIQAGWFKKENFKIQRYNIMAENKLNLRALEKRLGLTKTSSSGLVEHETPSILSTIASVIPTIRGMEPQKLADLVDLFVNRGYASEEEVEEKPMDWLLKFAEENPKVAKGFVDGILRSPQGATEAPPSGDVGY